MNTIQNRTALELALNDSLTASIRKAGGIRHEDGTFVSATTIEEWMQDGQFIELLTYIRSIIDTILDRLVQGGLPTEQLDQEVRDSVEQWSIQASLTAATPWPATAGIPVNPSRRRAFVEDKKQHHQHHPQSPNIFE